MPVKIIIRENGKQCMTQMPAKTTLRLYFDDSRLVFKCMQRHQCIATQLPCYYSFVKKKCHCKITWEMYGNRKYLFRNKGYCYVYTWEGVTRGQLRPIDLKSSIIFCYLLESLAGQHDLVVSAVPADGLAPAEWFSSPVYIYINCHLDVGLLYILCMDFQESVSNVCLLYNCVNKAK